MTGEDDSPIPLPVRVLFTPDFYHPEAADLRSMGPLHMCPCGCDLFHLLVRFDEGVVAYYFLDMICASCGSLATAPTEID